MATLFKVREFETHTESAPEGVEQGMSHLPPSDTVCRMLAQRVDREFVRMIPSLGAEMARNAGQAELDAFRVLQAYRVAEETTNGLFETMARMAHTAQRHTQAHPDFASDYAEVTENTLRVLKQYPPMATVGYGRRYYVEGTPQRALRDC